MHEERRNGSSRAKFSSYASQEVVEDGEWESTLYGKSEITTDK